MEVKPYSTDGSKREEVERMFDAISPRYDLLNRLFSLGIDQRWRRKVVRMLAEEPVAHLLDVATGTADLALLGAGHATRVTGVDVSDGMLTQGRAKVERAGQADRVTLIRAASEALPFPDGKFDAATVAFGVRNFADLTAGMREMHRVLRPGGRLFVLEFSRPRGPLAPFFRFYFHHVMPTLGRWISGDSVAYSYLPRSVDAFPEGSAFVALLAAVGFTEVHALPLTGGVATLYQAHR